MKGVNLMKQFLCQDIVLNDRRGFRSDSLVASSDVSICEVDFCVHGADGIAIHVGKVQGIFIPQESYLTIPGVYYTVAEVTGWMKSCPSKQAK